MDIDVIRKYHSVKVCGGSGVIVRALDKSVLYILTNYHVVVGEDGMIKNLQFEFEANSPLKADNIKPIDKILCEDDDIAIIKINAQGLDEIHFLRLGTQSTKADSHVGFPGARIENAVDKIMVLHICQHDGSVNDHLVEYEYNQQIRNDEIKGMSGGGIFDKDFHLIGIHKQSSNIDAKECLGKATYIPISLYKDFIKKEGWSPIQEFNLDSFSIFTCIAFNIDDAYAKDIAESLLDSLDIYKERLESLSPEKVTDILKTRGRIRDDIVVEELKEELWVDFTEFLIGIMVILNIDEMQDDFILSVYDKFHFIFCQENFDFYEVRERLDPNTLIGMQKNAKLFIGGLNNSGTFKGCVLDSKIPNISKAGIYNIQDITRSKRDLLKRMTIINAKIFKKGVMHCIDCCDEINIDTYKQLLKARILNNNA